MRILFVCENYLPHYGGAEVVFKNLAEGYVKKGHHVSLVTHRLKGTKKYELINGVKVYRINCFRNRYLFSFFSIPTVIKLAKKNQIIQTTSFNGAPPAWLAAKLTRKPVVITVHEVWVNKWHKVTDLTKLSCFIHNFLEKMIYLLNFNKYICVSNATRNDLLQLNINKKKATTIYNGLDYNFWNPAKYDGKKIRKELELKEKFIYFSWGRPGSSKGFEYLIKAVPYIYKRIPNSTCLLMLGSAEKYPQKFKKIKTIANKVGEDKIKIISSVRNEELGDYIKAADCVVIPSIAEGFGYTAVEACAMDKPIIVTNAGSLPEVVSGKFVMVNPKSAREIAKGVEKMFKCEIKSMPLKKFTWNEAIDSYLKIYLEFLDF